METVVAHVQPSNSGSSSKKSSPTAEGPGAGGNNPLTSATTIDSPSSTTKSNPSVSTSSSATAPVTVNNSSNSSSSSNPIFVITNSSSSSSVGGVPSNSNNLEMPSNSHPTSVTCGGESVVSSSACTGGGAHSEDDDGGGIVSSGVPSGVNGGGGNTGTSSTSVVSSTAGTTSQQQQRHSNPRQSTLTRSHAITLDEDSDGASSQAPDSGGGVTKSLPQEQEQELIHFIIDTCNRNVKDKHFILRIEADLTQFVKDESRLTLPFPQMTSYQRMLVHRMATLFDLDHNVDNSSGGNFVVVSKDLNGRGHGGHIPPIRFKELPSNPAMIVSTSPSSHVIASIDPSANSEVILIDPSSGNTLSTAPGTTSTSSKKILKREKVPGLGSDKKGAGGAAKTKSLEERTQDYHKARRRIFEDNSGESGSGVSLDNSVSASSKKLNWSSTDSSEDRMYLKPPFPGNTSGGKLIKVESFESASQKKPSNRDSRAMGKSHSFGGYEENSQPPSGGGHSGRVAVGKNFPGGANNSSNNASSSMISCSSSSSLRSSSFSKQDSSSSTTSGSGQSPSGGTSSGSTSGYKSSSSSGGSGGGAGIVPNYYTGGGLNGANSGGPLGATTPLGPMQNDPMKPPAIIFAPAGGPPHQQIFQSEDMSVGQGGMAPNSSQQVVFCCWAVTDVNNVPPGAVIIDPTTGQTVRNTDGTQYYYDPTNPPKFVQTMPAATPIPVPQPPPPSTPQQQDPYAPMYPPAVIAGPPITAYTPMQPTQPPQTPTGTGSAPPPAAFMTIPAAAAASQIYFPPPSAPVSTANTSTGSPQDIQDLSGYFTQLSMAAGPGGRQAQPSVIYVPVDALNAAAATYATPLQSDQQSQGTYYEDSSQSQSAPQQIPPAIPIQFQAPGAGYVLQQVVDPSGGSAPGVYYYGGVGGGNIMQTPTMQTSNSNSVPQHSHNTVSHQQQPRFKNWVMSHPPQQQHPSSQTFSIHGASGQVTPAQQQNNPPGVGHPSGAIMLHPSVPPNSMVPGGPGLVSVPTVLPPPHPGALSGAQQQPAQQLPQQPPQQNSTLVPLSYHPSQSHHSQHPQPGPAAANAPTLMQTLVPCVQSPVFPAPPPQPPPPPPLSHQAQPQQHQPQSFVPPPPQHHQQHQHHPSSHPHHSHHSTRPHHHHQNHPHGLSQHHQNPHHSHNQPRFLAVTGSSAAAAAAAAAASQQQQQQQQILFAAAAAAMAMSNNYSNFAAGATGTNSTRFIKGTGRGGGGAGVHHGAVTGVVRRSKNFSINKQQPNNSSK